MKRQHRFETSDCRYIIQGVVENYNAASVVPFALRGWPSIHSMVCSQPNLIKTSRLALFDSRKGQQRDTLLELVPQHREEEQTEERQCYAQFANRCDSAFRPIGWRTIKEELRARGSS